MNYQQFVSPIDYTIRIPKKVSGENIGCVHCANRATCQYFIEIFTEHPRGWRNTINHRTETDFIGLICKMFLKEDKSLNNPQRTT